MRMNGWRQCEYSMYVYNKYDRIQQNWEAQRFGYKR